eukprot:m.27122 g.27122  ORF g.27122 m.27122 type:complete len:469 (-) comp15691_c0_seq1:160-1566(-)
MVNWNNTLAYTTPKLVKVRDWRLGALNYVLKVAIFGYIVFELFYSKGYMKMEQITGGVVTANTNSPVGEYKGGQSNLDYCCDECEPWYEPKDKAGNMTCLFWDGYQSDYPASMNQQVAMTSRVRVTREVALPGCTTTSWGENCSYVPDDTTPGPNGTITSGYVANLEKFTIMIRHGVHGMSVSTEGASTGPTAITGKLVKTHGVIPLFSTPEILRSWPNSTRFDIGGGIEQPQDQTRPGDIMRLEEILEALGVSLDDQQSESTESYRFAGINIVMYISYSMLQLDFTGDAIEYKYEPRLLSDLEYKIEEEKILDGGNSREIFNRHAVRIIFVQTGMVGKPDTQALLLTLVTGLGLLAISSTIVEALMTYCFRLRKYYTWYKYEITEDIDKVIADENHAHKLTLMESQIEEGKGHYWNIKPTNHYESDIYESTDDSDTLKLVVGKAHVENGQLIANSPTSNHSSENTPS